MADKILTAEASQELLNEIRRQQARAEALEKALGGGERLIGKLLVSADWTKAIWHLLKDWRETVRKLLETK